MGLKLNLDESDIEWLKKYHPTLLFFSENETHCLQGTIEVNIFYDKKIGRLYINPSVDLIRKNPNYYILDYFEIYIEFNRPNLNEVAVVKEIGGRLDRLAKQKNIAITDLHVYADNRLCLHGYYNLKDCLPNGFNIMDFINNLIIPFFYSQSYFEKYGEWPLGEYLHGDAGKFQNYIEKNPVDIITKYFDNKEKINNFLYHIQYKNGSFRYKHICICNSGNQISNCDCGFKEVIGHESFGSFFKKFIKKFEFSSDNRKALKK